LNLPPCRRATPTCGFPNHRPRRGEIFKLTIVIVFTLLIFSFVRRSRPTLYEPEASWLLPRVAIAIFIAKKLEHSRRSRLLHFHTLAKQLFSMGACFPHRHEVPTRSLQPRRPPSRIDLLIIALSLAATANQDLRNRSIMARIACAHIQGNAQ